MQQTLTSHKCIIENRKLSVYFYYYSEKNYNHTDMALPTSLLYLKLAA